MSAEPGAATVVVLSGPVTLYETSEVREILLSALEEGKNFVVNLEASGPWDIAGLQLLLATIASSEKRGLKVRLADVPGVCREVAERSGLGEWLAAQTDSFA